MALKLFQKVTRANLILGILFFSLAALMVIADRAPMHLEKRFPDVSLREDLSRYLDGVVHAKYPGPYVYRILVPYTEHALLQALSGIQLVDIDGALKLTLLFVVQVVFFSYLRSFFPVPCALAGVLLLDCLVAFSLSSFQGPTLAETSDILNLVIFSIALQALMRNSFPLFSVVLFVGTFNRETTWFLLPILWLDDFQMRRGFLRALAALASVAAPYVTIRSLIEVQGDAWFTFEGLERNIPFLSKEYTATALVGNLHVIFLLGPLLLAGLYRFNGHPRFLRVAASITPLFILVHYAVGTIVEARLWMPLFVVLIPLALTTITTLVQPNDY